ncbi:uncharacterized protein LOC106642924 [Copidosoma floridanum]|uniref:uncharacterized protein LOC106642924 n=1 Tax=Copidosoma floridanum TaxID=29053 RepID=UPI0006C99C64|nr:uncharacterized protein LOC106642924 [Copidosoma floridanum]
MLARISESSLARGLRRCGEKITKAARMKYSPQQQQKDRKSESEMSSVNATPSRAASALQRSTSAATAAAASTSALRRLLTHRPLNGEMFAWMRVFRLASMLNHAYC